MNKRLNYVFFGTSDFAVIVLEELSEAGYVPTCIVTAPDRPAGRGMQLQSPPVKVWAEKYDIPVLQPDKLSDPDFLYVLRSTNYKLGVVAAYGKILPPDIINMPKHGTLNVHPSLLPHHRGPAPVEGQILADDPDDVGVSIMLLDKKMDHGPLLAQTKVQLEQWPPTKSDLEEILAHEGGTLLAHILPEWVTENITPKAQNHNEATYTSLISKQDAKLDLENDDSRMNYLKIRAYDKNPTAYFLSTAGKHVKVTDAEYKDGTLIITKVIPEGKKEMRYKDFLTMRE